MTAMTPDRIRALEHILVQQPGTASPAAVRAATEGNELFASRDQSGELLAAFQAAADADGRAEVISTLLDRADTLELAALLDALDCVAAELQS